MSTALTDIAQRAPGTVIDRGGIQALSITAMKQRAEMIVEAIANVMVEGKHYGKIPGTDKPTLYKPGAELLCMMFYLAPVDPQIDELGTSDEIRYRLHVPIQAVDGRLVAVGIGEGSTNEEKYRWRKPVCDEEWQETDAALRREKYFKGGSSGHYKGKQIRTSPADLANTVLKMAHKRALIHATLLATGASSVFNQDLEDFTEELRESVIDGDESPEQPKQPQRASASGGKATAAKPVPADAKVAIGFVVKVEEPTGKKYSTIKLRGDNRNFNAWKDSAAALINEAKAFAGTEHQVRLTFTESVKDGKTYYNPIGIAIADEPQAAQQPTGGLPIGDPVKNPAEFSPFHDEPGSDG